MRIVPFGRPQNQRYELVDTEYVSFLYIWMGHNCNGLLGDLETMIHLAANSMDAIYDNSKAFNTFLRNQGIDRVLSVNRLKLRKNHKLVPHVRLGVRV